MGKPINQNAIPVNKSGTLVSLSLHRPPAAMLPKASVIKRLAPTTRSSESDRCVDLAGRFAQKQLDDLKTRGDQRKRKRKRKRQRRGDHYTEQHRHETCRLDAGDAADRTAVAVLILKKIMNGIAVT